MSRLKDRQIARMMTDGTWDCVYCGIVHPLELLNKHIARCEQNPNNIRLAKDKANVRPPQPVKLPARRIIKDNDTSAGGEDYSDWARKPSVVKYKGTWTVDHGSKTDGWTDPAEFRLTVLMTLAAIASAALLLWLINCL